MRDEPARDAVRNALDRDVPYLGPEGREQRVENVLAALGIPPTTTVSEISAGLWFLAHAGSVDVSQRQGGTWVARDRDRYSIRDGFECCQDGGYRTSRCPYCRYTMERPPCVVVTGRTAQDVERLLREPTDEDIEHAARALHARIEGKFQWEHDTPGAHQWYRDAARAAIAAYRSHEEADRA